MKKIEKAEALNALPILIGELGSLIAVYHPELAIRVQAGLAATKLTTILNGVREPSMSDEYLAKFNEWYEDPMNSSSYWVSAREECKANFEAMASVRKHHS